MSFAILGGSSLFEGLFFKRKTGTSPVPFSRELALFISFSLSAPNALNLLMVMLINCCIFEVGVA